MIGIPTCLDPDEFLSEMRGAAEFLRDEASHSRQPQMQFVDPSGRQSGGITEADIKMLKQKHSFLADFSDSFIRSTPIGDLMKIESTAMKAKELERGKDSDDKLLQNKSNLATCFTEVQQGSDNRWNQLHQARFLGGASCSAAKLWLAAREAWGTSHPPAIGNYDMGAVGLAGYVSSAGWVNIHNPASCKLSVRQFNINNCSAKASGKKGSEGEEDILELGEFKLAIRALRTAMAFVMPWNFSVMALEGFFLQTNFCAGDLEKVEKKALILTRFSDYVLQQNADKWRDAEPFLSAGELKAAWAAFFGAQPQSVLAKQKQQNKGASKQGGNSHQKPHDPRLSLGICFAWNNGQCNKPAGACTTAKGRALKHVCDFAADPAKPTEVCGKDHIRKEYHK
jgi:hypothetical protein